MQNIESDKENENPQHFHPTNDTPAKQLNCTNSHQTLTTTSNFNIGTEFNVSEPTDYSNSTTTKPKFSFATDYTPSRQFSTLLPAPAVASTYPFEPQYPLSVSSFTVLNNDYGGSLVTSKPNAIVRPIRRSQETALPNNHNVLGRELRITGYPAPGGLSVTHPQYGREVRTFAEELNRKLSFLNSSCGSREFGLSRFNNLSQNGSNQDTLNQRPLFITTVPRGIFLPPPKEITLVSPSRKRQLYAYSSHPVVYNATTTSSLLNEHHHLQQPHSTIDHHTHDSHKMKATRQHQNQPQYYQSYSSSAVAKDKFQNSHSGVGGTGAKTAYGSGGSGGGSDGTAIIPTDKNKNISTTIISTTSPSKASLHFIPNAARGPCASSTATSATPMPAGISITKQQFQQQLQQTRSKRETPPVEPYKNVMHDRRVIRGSNYGGNPLLGDYDPFDKAAEFRRRQALRKKNVNHKNQRNILGTPPPVTGRRHEDVQTERYLEELVSRPPDLSVETQTDLFLEKPPTPPYIPAKIGVDIATEILDGELFQFDAEAQPIIDVLVDSTIELSILEVAHEQEIHLIRQRQAELLAHSEAELAELRRLEVEETRLQAEKERRLRQDNIAKSLDDEMQKEVTAAKLLQGHIASILPEILENLEPATDAAKKEKLMQTLCPWLSAEVAEEVGHIVDSREILTVIIQEIIKQRAEIYADYKEEVPSAKLEHIDEEEHEPTEDVCEAETEELPSASGHPEI